jgi:hypothetical protein
MRPTILWVCALALGAGGCKDPSEAHAAALVQAAKCAEVTDALGTPLDGVWFGYHQNTSAGYQAITVEGSISGPKGSGDIEFDAEKGSGWSIKRGKVVVKGKTIDIVACTAPSAAPSSS